MPVTSKAKPDPRPTPAEKRAEKLIESGLIGPPGGVSEAGFHPNGVKAAWSMKKTGVSRDGALDTLRAISKLGERTVEEVEIISMIEKAYDGQHQRITRQAKKQRPLVSREAVAAALATDSGEADLSERSPAKGKTTTNEILSRIYSDNALICTARLGPKKVQVRERKEIKRPEECKYLVPNPMRKREGFTKEGKASERCLDNGSVRHRIIVVEFDFTPQQIQEYGASCSTHDACARLLFAEWDWAQPFMVVRSPGKSLHAWYNVVDLSSQQVGNFFSIWLSKGADPTGHNLIQLFRMPGGEDENENPQPTLYWDESNAPGELA